MKAALGVPQCTHHSPYQGDFFLKVYDLPELMLVDPILKKSVHSIRVSFTITNKESIIISDDLHVATGFDTCLCQGTGI